MQNRLKPLPWLIVEAPLLSPKSQTYINPKPQTLSHYGRQRRLAEQLEGSVCNDLLAGFRV